MSFDGQPKFSALLRQFQRTYFATERCKQVCCFAGVVRAIVKDQLQRSSLK